MCWKKTDNQRNHPKLSANDITSAAVRLREDIKISNGHVPYDAKFLNGAAHPMEATLCQGGPNPIANPFYNAKLSHRREDKGLQYDPAVWSKINWVKHKYLLQKDDVGWQKKYGHATRGYEQWLKDWWYKSPKERSYPSGAGGGRGGEHVVVVKKNEVSRCERTLC